MKNKWINIPILLLLSIIWGFSFILMKKGMFTSDGELIFSSEQVASLRILFASIAILPLSIKLFRTIKSWKYWILLFTSGLCGNFIPAFLFTFAEQKIDSGYAGMLNSFTPIFTLLIGAIAFSRTFKITELIGIFIGAIGAITLGTQNNLQPTEGNSIYLLAIILATALYGLNINLIKKHLSHLSPQQISAGVFLTLLIPSIYTTATTNTYHTIQTHPQATQALGYIATLGIIGTACTTLLYNRIIATSSPIFASTVTLLIPIVAILIAHVSGEKITIGQLLGIGITLIGVIFITVITSAQTIKK